jgi:hypothetical protein
LYTVCEQDLFHDDFLVKQRQGSNNVSTSPLQPADRRMVRPAEKNGSPSDVESGNVSAVGKTSSPSNGASGTSSPGPNSKRAASQSSPSPSSGKKIHDNPKMDPSEPRPFPGGEEEENMEYSM